MSRVIVPLNPPANIESCFNQTTTTNATFNLGKSFGHSKIKIYTNFICSNSGFLIYSKKTTHTNKAGELTIDVPAYTTDIGVIVKCYKARSMRFIYNGAPCGSTPLSYLSGADLDRFIMLRFADVLTINTSGYDHSLPNKDQGGPHRSSRAIAMTMVAAFDAYNSIIQAYHDYLNLTPVDKNANAEAAIIQATLTCLIALFPQQTASLNTVLTDTLASIPEGTPKAYGIMAGNIAAMKMLLLRDADGAGPPASPEQVIGTGPGQYVEGPEPLYWQKDPLNPNPHAVGSTWGSVTPFVIPSADHFRPSVVPAFPSLDSTEYACAFNETKSVGGDGIITPTVRGDDYTFIGNYWAYDGTQILCAPVRMYNQIANQIATQEQYGPAEYGRLIAQMNLILADCGISCWESKYTYKIWRPVTAIRYAGDAALNPATIPDPNFTPYGAPNSNTTNNRFTPPFPSFPSGHGTFGGGLFELLRTRFTDNVHFTFTSDEYNGITHDQNGVRPLKPRSFTSFSQAEEENAQSRMYLGIHWNPDKKYGIALGNAVADYVINNTYSPLV
jgi:hypothetical protein